MFEQILSAMTSKYHPMLFNKSQSVRFRVGRLQYRSQLVLLKKKLISKGTRKILITYTILYCVCVCVVSFLLKKDRLMLTETY